MTTRRWTLTDTATGETWTMPINPDQMTSPLPSKNLRTAAGNRHLQNRVRGFLLPPSTPTVWEWQGVIRSKDHYDALLAWAQKSSAVRVTDHLGRTWDVAMNEFVPEDRKPTARVDWRLRYTMKVWILRSV